MKLVIKNSGKVRDIFSKELEPAFIDDKVQSYDMKKLQEWEQRYSEILKLLDIAENQEGIKLLFALAEEGYPEARWLLSDMYLKGQGLPESFDKALEWDHRAQFAEGFFYNKRT
jgi:TPR repeat protein